MSEDDAEEYRLQQRKRDAERGRWPGTPLPEQRERMARQVRKAERLIELRREALIEQRLRRDTR